jgi:hypothetical protein
MNKNFTLIYFFDTTENLNDLNNIEDLFLQQQIEHLEGEDPSEKSIRKILEYAG